MDDEIKQCRILAVQRFKSGEGPESICTSLDKSKVWLYKWLKRFSKNDASRFEERSRRPLSVPHRTPAEIEHFLDKVDMASV